MSNKILSDSGKILSSQSLSGSFASASIDMRGAHGAWVDFQWSSGSNLSGNLKLRGSSTQDIWTDLASNNISGSSGSGAFEYTEAEAGYIRLEYSSITGSGNLDAYFNVKW